ncbi:MAG: thioesterase domain-containing protein [Gammaproteobacteria bacterium]|nr:thioesterase domain-containing protein [Gammaproteobacteria bacterium]
MKQLTATELKHLLYTQIPLTESMGIEVIQADPTCAIVSAPLQPNINHQGTVFGGSANTLAIVSAYSLLYLRLNTHHPQCHILIQQNTMQYEHPIEGEMIARCEFDDAARWSRFMKTLLRHGRARISLDAIVRQNEQCCASFKGDFVALCH